PPESLHRQFRPDRHRNRASLPDPPIIHEDERHMDKQGRSAERVYYWRPEVRALLGLVWGALAAFFLFGLADGIDYQINHPESRWQPLEQFFGFAFLVILDLFLILTAIA